MSLTSQQKEAVTKDIDKHLAIYAVAGSGKTSVIVGRIKYLYGKGFKKQLVITFTKKAASNVKRRLGNITEGVYIGTFHSFCYGMLKKYIPNYVKYEIIDSDDFRINIWISKILEETSSDACIADIQALALKYDTGGKHVSELHPASDNGLCSVVIKVKKTTLEHGKRTFSDLLVDFLYLIKTNPQIRQEIQEMYPIIMVDEFQDTDTTQMNILRLLSEKCHLSVVGDVSQAIYSSFRGCSPEYLLNTEKYFGATHTINMSRNFRSGGKILEAANQLIVNNKVRANITIDVLDEAGHIDINRSGDRNSEAQTICDRIKAQGEPWDRFAVLFRTNAQSAFFESELARLEIPFESGDSKGFFGLVEIKPFVEYLKIAIDPTNISSLQAIWNKPNRFLKADLIKTAAEKVKTANVHAVLDEAKKLKLNIKQRREISNLDGVVHWLTSTKDASPNELLRGLYGKLSYDKWLKDVANMSAFKKYPDMADNVRALFDVAKNFKTVKQFLANIKRVQQNNKKNKEDVLNKVNLLTIHRSKGLEFNHVFLAGAERDLMPHHKSADLEEERRLAYVAFTRPKNHLSIYYVGEPSQFLTEAGLDVKQDQITD